MFHYPMDYKHGFEFLHRPVSDAYFSTPVPQVFSKASGGTTALFLFESQVAPLILCTVQYTQNST